jgi:hypothetical protein
VGLDIDRVSVRAPRYPDEAPYWPCALFLYDDEVVAALYFDDLDSAGYPVDDQGVLQKKMEETG